MIKRLSMVLTLIVIAVMCGYFYNFFEYYKEEVDNGWSVKANQNPYLALELLSEKRNIPVFSTDNFQKIGNLYEYDVIYISDSTLVLSEQRLNTVLEWVKQGGHLIVSALYHSEEDNDRLLSYFGFFQDASFYSDNYYHERADFEEYSEEDAKEQIKAREERYDTDDLTQLSFTGVEGALLGLFDNDVFIDHPAFYDNEWQSNIYKVDYWRGSKYGAQFTQLSYGGGLVSVMAGNEIWQSESIDLFDHAYLWLILNGGKKTAILYGSNMPSLFSIMKKYLPEVIYSSLALLIIWLWWRMKRFGPTREIEIQSRRSYSEHITASARFFWRRHWQDKLLEPLRNNTMSLAEARIAGFTQANNEERHHILSKQSGLSTSQVYQAFENNARLNQDLFINTVQDLQRIRESL